MGEDVGELGAVWELVDGNFQEIFVLENESAKRTFGVLIWSSGYLQYALYDEKEMVVVFGEVF